MVIRRLEGLDSVGGLWLLKEVGAWVIQPAALGHAPGVAGHPAIHMTEGLPATWTAGLCFAHPVSFSTPLSWSEVGGRPETRVVSTHVWSLRTWRLRMWLRKAASSGEKLASIPGWF